MNRGLCIICGSRWPHTDGGHRASCAHAQVVVIWREVDHYVDVTSIGPPGYPVDVPTLLRCAGIELRVLPGRLDRFWGPAWAVQVCCSTVLKQEDRVRFVEEINKKPELREAAEAVALAGESVVHVLRKAVAL